MSDGQVTNINWKIKTGEYSSGELCYLGAWVVGSVHHDGFVNRHDPHKWAACCVLPGIKKILGHFETMENAKKKVEKAVKHWASKAFAEAQ